MSFLEYSLKTTPTGLSKLLYFNWPLIVLVSTVAGFGFMMLYSVAGGSMDRWAEPQMIRFGLGMGVMFVVGLVPIWFWRNVSGVAYVVSILLLLYVEFFGAIGGGSQRWIDLGFVRLQPSEMAKITIVMLLAAYYDWLPPRRQSHPLYVLIPVVLILIPVLLTLRQPDLGTALLLLVGGAAVMFIGGVHWLYFAGVGAIGAGGIAAVFASRGTDWQLIEDYQFRRIDTFLDPSLAPLGDGYHITQSQIALGSGGWNGRGFMQGTQIRGDFLPEAHTDFIFPTLAEEFGFVGGTFLLTLYVLILVFCIVTAMQTRDRYAAIVSLGVAFTFFLYFAINMAMVMGLAPVVGVPLPLVSYGGSAMLVLLAAFGLVHSANIHRPR
ncbi:rod shape-determining protein RodA [Rhodobacterales bacterium HKCCE3408]|nr:rod shape-determining protein RodA [Rhodobacterales bacterium HKCCE3408]